MYSIPAAFPDNLVDNAIAFGCYVVCTTGDGMGHTVWWGAWYSLTLLQHLFHVWDEPPRSRSVRIDIYKLFAQLAV